MVCTACNCRAWQIKQSLEIQSATSVLLSFGLERPSLSPAQPHTHLPLYICSKELMFHFLKHQQKGITGQAWPKISNTSVCILLAPNVTPQQLTGILGHNIPHGKREKINLRKENNESRMCQNFLI